MRLVVKILLPLLVIGASVWVARLVIANRPVADRRPPTPSIIAVEATHLTRQNYQVIIRTQGTVQPHTESTLIPQVTGQVVSVSPSFREGRFFEAGEILLGIDARDYEIAVTVAESELASAQATLEEEKGRAQVAERERKQMRSRNLASELALRKPQLAAALARLSAAEAQLAKARLNLERTLVKAPYPGRVWEQKVDIGQYVTAGTVLARIYAVDYAEIRLPLTNRQLEFVSLPERYRDVSNGSSEAAPKVTVKAEIGRHTYAWKGGIVRSEGTVDTRSRQLFVIAQVPDPYAKGPGDRPPLRIGQFVSAEIEGEMLRDVFVLPRAALQQGNEILLVDADQRLQRRQVSIVWSDGEHAIVADGLPNEAVLSLTPLPGIVSGVRVTATIDGVAPTEPANGAAAKRLAQQEEQATRQQ